jgi:hypothetical protein
MEKMNWTDCVRNEEVLNEGKKERDILQKLKRKEG